MTILGITGGIATGKSTVTQMFADLGAQTASADQIARDLLAPGTPSTVAVAAAFPSSVSSTDPLTIDRRALAAIIFADETARGKLEAILHPPIVDALLRRIDQFRQSNSHVAAVEIPLLFEGGLTELVDKIVVVAVDEETQLTRLQDRLKIDRASALQQLASQWPLPRKIESADYVIDSSLPLSEMGQQVQEVWDSCQAKPPR